jgi:hypothetical protein
MSYVYTVKNGWRFSRPQQGCHLPNSPTRPGIMKISPASESLVSDLPARDGKTANLFYSVGGVHALWNSPNHFLPLYQASPGVSDPSAKSISSTVNYSKGAQ